MKNMESDSIKIILSLFLSLCHLLQTHCLSFCQFSVKLSELPTDNPPRSDVLVGRGPQPKTFSPDNLSQKFLYINKNNAFTRFQPSLILKLE
jgi:hypothetical protein